MKRDHERLEDIGRIQHVEIDATMQRLRLMPITITGARDDPEAVLASLLVALAKLGLIIDNTTAT